MDNSCGGKAPKQKPEYPHKAWCDQLLADLDKRPINDMEALGLLTAHLFEHAIANMIPYWRDEIMRATGKVNDEAGLQHLNNLQTITKTAIKVSRGMGSDVSDIMERNKPPLIQKSICLKHLTGNLYCSLPKGHAGGCA